MRTREEQVLAVAIGLAYPLHYDVDHLSEAKDIIKEAEQRGYERARAECAADTATKAHIVPHNIPDDRMQVAKNTLYCWKGGALSDEDAIGMIVCAVANAPLRGGGNG